ncbi:hypothetical protein LJD63_02685 [Veillonella nakazawae]|uniref:Chromosome partition protein Smc n=1 Tax=Veillonella nakazawae TaxID=2682456 RepID=A0AB35HBM3_9FIRM|nr:hypothetical protein [Veillonella nakazawae]MCB8605170.1 hypothetical protein [Veillonella nakazawae]MDU3275846.1 hypothetical protein [Veillonella sp.]
MNYINELIEADLKYICSVIPYEEIIKYFKQNPKEFFSLKPGFRVESLNADDVIEILFSFKNRKFISSFIVQNITRWIDDINYKLEDSKKRGLTLEEQYIYVLAHSAFSQNIPLYFKVIEEEKPEDYLNLLSAAVNQLLEIIDKVEGIEKKHCKNINEKESTISNLKESVNASERVVMKLRTQLINAKSNEASMSKLLSIKEQEKLNLCKENKKLKDGVSLLNEQIKELSVDKAKSTTVLTKQHVELIKQIEELKGKLTSYKEKTILLDNAKSTISRLENQILEKDKSIQSLVEIKQNYEIQINVLEESLSNIDNKKKLNSAIVDTGVESLDESLLMPYRPVDMDDFEEYFNYNLNNIGLNDSFEGYQLFVQFFERVAFNGMPLLIKQAPGINLANCLANTIYGKKSAAILTYSSEVGLNNIRAFLTNTLDRVVCLDGFIGNCNEIELLSSIEQYRNKIIILTYRYDRTLNYIPMELLGYVQYINVDEFKPLMRYKHLTEDPSEIAEEPYPINSVTSVESRYHRIFEAISEECGLSKDVINSMSDLIDSEQYMNSVLLFSVLPYISKVIQLNPYKASKRLQKYAGESGKCPNKAIIWGWFSKWKDCSM